MKDICIGMLGNVDSGKTSTLGQLITKQKDNGNGKLRSLISRHPHEISSGRTSDIAYHSTFFKDNRITFIDLAGHEKYLKTTVAGLNTFIPDLIFLCIDKYAPTYKMTKEHFGLAIRMNIPIVILMTKIDLYDKQITDSSIELLSRTIRRLHRKITEVSTVNDLKKINRDDSKGDEYQKEIPLFRISNVSHEGVDLLSTFLSDLKLSNLPRSHFVHAKKFVIDRTYTIKGIGTVVSGFNGSSSPISVGDKMFIGGNSREFQEVVIRSIHDDFRKECKSLPSNTRGCLGIRFQSRTPFKIQGGLILSSTPVNSVSEFTAEIEILSSHSTSIVEGYQTVVHCGAIRRTAILSKDDRGDDSKRDDKGDDSNGCEKESRIVFRGGMKGRIKFRLTKPAYIEVGQSIFFREGRVIGDGKVV